MTMMIDRATLVLKNEPESAARMQEILDYVIDQYKPETTRYSYELSDDLPEYLPVNIADQLSAQKRDGGPNAVYLVVWMD